MTKWFLFSLLADKGTAAAYLTDSNGVQHCGIVEAIEREDGSGASFNVRLATVNAGRVIGGGKILTIHVRTID